MNAVTTAQCDTPDLSDREAVFQRYSRYLFRIVLRWMDGSAPLGPAVGADDLVQEIAASVIQNYDRYDPRRGPFTHWLGMLARTTMHNLLGRRTAQKRGGRGRCRGTNWTNPAVVQTKSIFDENLRPRRVADPSAKAPHAGLHDDFWKLVGRNLNEKEQRVVEMRFRQDLTFTEIGARFGLTKMWAYKHYNLALEKLNRERHRLVRAAG